MKTASRTSYLRQLAEPVVPGEPLLTVRRRALSYAPPAPVPTLAVPRAMVGRVQSVPRPAGHEAVAPSIEDNTVHQEKASVAQPEDRAVRAPDLYVADTVTKTTGTLPEVPLSPVLTGGIEEAQGISAFEDTIEAIALPTQAASSSPLPGAGAPPSIRDPEPPRPHEQLEQPVEAPTAARPRASGKNASTGVHIGTIEVHTAVRSIPEPAPPPTPSVAPVAQPLGRPLAWRYGLVQG